MYLLNEKGYENFKLWLNVFPLTYCYYNKKTNSDSTEKKEKENLFDNFYIFKINIHISCTFIFRIDENYTLIV